MKKYQITEYKKSNWLMQIYKLNILATQQLKMTSKPVISTTLVLVVMLSLANLGAPLPVLKLQGETESFFDRSCSDAQLSQCKSESTQSCSSLKNALLNTYDNLEGVHLAHDTPSLVFSSMDLLYSGLISDNDTSQANPRDAILESSEWEDKSRERCDDLLSSIQLSTEDTGACQWSYTCKYNPHYFPSFTVEAELSSWSVAHRCSKISTRSIKYVRTPCEANPEEDHWCRCNAGLITTGYRRSG